MFLVHAFSKSNVGLSVTVAKVLLTDIKPEMCSPLSMANWMTLYKVSCDRRSASCRGDLALHVPTGSSADDVFVPSGGWGRDEKCFQSFGVFFHSHRAEETESDGRSLTPDPPCSILTIRTRQIYNGLGVVFLIC